jgi:elongation factor Ts
MTITAAMVKELRERSGAGMMECKKALAACNGDIETAMAEMRKAGQAKADKKASRTAAEGIIIIRASDDNQHAVMLEVNSETDFVARDDTFNAFCGGVCDVALEANIKQVDVLSNTTMKNSELTVEQARAETVAKIGENIKLRRLENIKTDGVVGHYLHGTRIGVVVKMTGGDVALAKDIAMHIAASRPLVVSRDEVDESLVNKEREIFTAQAQESGKPPEIIEKMIGGRINKYLDEVSLLGQVFVKNPDMKVGKLLQEKQAKVESFIRFEVGEGLEKKEDNFVEEVMAQVREA